MAEQSRINALGRRDNERLVFELPSLPYGLKDLEPILSAETLEIHHGKHHARYVETLNRLLGEQNFSAQSLEEIVRIAHGCKAKGVFNNAAQAWNHSFFWGKYDIEVFQAVRAPRQCHFISIREP